MTGDSVDRSAGDRDLLRECREILWDTGVCATCYAKDDAVLGIETAKDCEDCANRLVRAVLEVAGPRIAKAACDAIATEAATQGKALVTAGLLEAVSGDLMWSAVRSSLGLEDPTP